MKVLFLTYHKIPHLGGVEKHIKEVSNVLNRQRYKLTTISSEDIGAPKMKLIGILYIWFWLYKNRRILINSDIIHCHDVFIWYLPFRFFYSNKKVYTTFHGWEGIWPIPLRNIFLRRIASKYSFGTIGVGKYIEKYYGIKVNKIIYGATPLNRLVGVTKKIKNKVVFLGRLEKDTGVLKFLKRLDKFKYRNVEFVGDGSLRSVCQKYGKVHGFKDPKPFLKKAEYVVPGGYLAYIEAKAYGCKTIVYADNQLKKDYWKDIQKIKKFPTWDELADIYISLWNS